MKDEPLPRSLNFLKLRLEKRESTGLLRERKIIQSAQQPACIVDEKERINFSSNDYLGLANNNQAKKKLAESAKKYGFGSAASHLICGHQLPHENLEKQLAKFVERDAAISFSSGYMANLAILQSLPQKGDLIIADKLNHASLIDGVKLSDANSMRYPHCDLHLLEKRLKNAGQNKFVVTDSVFSMDGDIAPLKEISDLCLKYNAILIVDDAHGFGVLGKNGRGCAEYFNLNQKQLPILMSTLGKALGGYGAFVSGKKILIDYLMQFARSYIYTTAMPAAIASANLANLTALEKDNKKLRLLAENIAYFKTESDVKKIPLLKTDTAIQPLVVGDVNRLEKINQFIFDKGFLVGAIRPPTVAKNSARLRITLSASHTKKQIKQLVFVLSEAFDRIKD